MDVAEVVRKLVGPIEPVGETHTDDKRYENLKAMTQLLDTLIFEVSEVARNNRGGQEYSRNRAGMLAQEFLNELKGELES